VPSANDNAPGLSVDGGLVPGGCRLWRDSRRSPFENMALDELLLERAPGDGQTVLRLYGWDRPAISIGYFQRRDAALEEAYAMVRRPTGGGLVRHDFDLTFSLVFPAGSPLHGINRFESYRIVNQAVCVALRAVGLAARLAERSAPVPDRERLDCFRTAAQHDVLGPNGKVAGGAQRRTHAGILHQGSIDRRHCDQVPWEELAAALEDGVQEVFGCSLLALEPSPDLLREARLLAAAKYATAEWNHRR